MIWHTDKKWNSLRKMSPIIISLYINKGIWKTVSRLKVINEKGSVKREVVMGDTTDKLGAIISRSKENKF